MKAKKDGNFTVEPEDVGRDFRAVAYPPLAGQEIRVLPRKEYDVTTVMEIFRVSRVTVCNWINGGLVKAERREYDQFFIPEAEVERMKHDTRFWGLREHHYLAGVPEERIAGWKPKRPRGRPRKPAPDVPPVKRPRGRPKKVLAKPPVMGVNPELERLLQEIE